MVLVRTDIFQVFPEHFWITLTSFKCLLVKVSFCRFYQTDYFIPPYFVLRMIARAFEQISCENGILNLTIYPLWLVMLYYSFANYRYVIIQNTVLKISNHTSRAPSGEECTLIDDQGALSISPINASTSRFFILRYDIILLVLVHILIVANYYCLTYAIAFSP